MPTTTDYDLSGCACCVTWCCSPSPRPDTVFGLISYDCAALNGKVVEFTWDAGLGWYEGSVTDDDGKVWGFALHCGNGDANCDDWILDAPNSTSGLDCFLSAPLAAGLCSCSPFEAHFATSISFQAGCCNGSIAFVMSITE